MLDLPSHRDARGVLTPFDLARLPFRPERVFTVTLAPAGTRRGGHGHRDQRQMLACVAGRVDVELRASGTGPVKVTLPPGRALLVEPGVWTAQTFETVGAVLLVLASGPYDPDEYFHEPPGA